MKKLILLAFIIFASCEKEKSQCYVCQWKTVKIDVTIIDEEVINIEKCNVTAAEILSFEAEKTKTWTEIEITTVGTKKTVRYESTCSCVSE